MIELRAYDNAIDLSHLHRVAARMAQAFEADAAEWPADHGRHGSDLLVQMTLQGTADVD